MSIENRLLKLPGSLVAALQSGRTELIDFTAGTELPLSIEMQKDVLYLVAALIDEQRKIKEREKRFKSDVRVALGNVTGGIKQFQAALDEDREET